MGPKAEPPSCPQHYQRGRNDHQVLHSCSDGCEIQRLLGSRTRIWITISFTIFVPRSNALIVLQEHNMLEKFLTRMRAIKIEGLCQKERLNTVPNHKSGPDSKSHSEADRSQPEAALHAGQRIRERTPCPAAKVADTPSGFVGKAQKKPLAHKLWLELTV